MVQLKYKETKEDVSITMTHKLYSEQKGPVSKYTSLSWHRKE